MKNNFRLYVLAAMIILIASAFVVPTTTYDAHYFVSGRGTNDLIWGEARPSSLNVGFAWTSQEFQLTQTSLTTVKGPHLWLAITVPFVEDQYQDRFGCSFQTWVYSTGLGTIHKDTGSACGWLADNG